MYDFLCLIKAIKKVLLCRTHKWKLPSLHTWYRAKASQSLKRFGVKAPGSPSQSCSHIFTFLALVLLFQASLSEDLGKGLSGLSDEATLWKEGETLKTLPTLTQYPVLSPSYLSPFLHLRVHKIARFFVWGSLNRLLNLHWSTWFSMDVSIHSIMVNWMGGGVSVFSGFGPSIIPSHQVIKGLTLSFLAYSFNQLL